MLLNIECVKNEQMLNHLVNNKIICNFSNEKKKKKYTFIRSSSSKHQLFIYLISFVVEFVKHRIEFDINVFDSDFFFSSFAFGNACRTSFVCKLYDFVQCR